MNLPIFTETKTGAFCSLELINGEYVMKGPTGTHALDAANTNDERLEAHWDGFIANNGGEIEESDIVEAIKATVERFLNEEYSEDVDYHGSPVEEYGRFFLPREVYANNGELVIPFLTHTDQPNFSDIRKILKPLRKLGLLKVATKKEVFEDWKEQNPYLYNWQFDEQDSYPAWHTLTVQKA